MPIYQHNGHNIITATAVVGRVLLGFEPNEMYVVAPSGEETWPPRLVGTDDWVSQAAGQPPIPRVWAVRLNEKNCEDFARLRPAAPDVLADLERLTTSLDALAATCRDVGVEHIATQPFVLGYDVSRLAKKLRGARWRGWLTAVVAAMVPHTATTTAPGGP